jgi:hypothetical protein
MKTRKIVISFHDIDLSDIAVSKGDDRLIGTQPRQDEPARRQDSVHRHLPSDNIRAADSAKAEPTLRRS